MKKRTRVMLISALVAVPALILGLYFAPRAHAEAWRSGDTVTVAAEEKIDSTLYTAGSTIVVEGMVNGDVFCAGQSVVISGEVAGDVICAGSTLSITGVVHGDVRLAGQAVAIDGEVVGSATILGESVTVGTEAIVASDVQVAASNFTLNGVLGRDLALGAETVVIDGDVARNVDAHAETIAMQDGATVGGDMLYRSVENQGVETSGAVAGSVSWEQQERAESSFSFAAFVATFAVISSISLLILSMALVLLIPQRFVLAAQRTREGWSTTFALGILATIAGPIMVAVLLLSVVGMSAGLILLTLLFVVYGVSAPFAAFIIGQQLLRKSTQNVVWYMLLGVAIVIALYLIPLVNILSGLVIVWFGGGMALRSIRFEKPVYIAKK